MEIEPRKLSLSRALAIAAVAMSLCAPAHAAPQYKVLHYFNGNDGSGPYGGVTLDPRGRVYGTTAGGGPCGTVFELLPQKNGQWKETVLYQFASSNDGCDPWSSLVFDIMGNLYGTTVGGGAYYYGTVFELEPGPGGWKETIPYSFGTQSGDGGGPTAGPVPDTEGNLYGTTPGGGVNGGGTVFKLTPGSGGWDETVLHSFHYSYYGHPAPGGSSPYAGLILDAFGNLYGTTAEGGANCNGWSCGVVYELTPVSGGGWKEIVLHRFHSDGKDGVTPGSGALFMDGSGNLYGTTETGGCCGGVVFRVAPQGDGRWKETILYAFRGGASGNQPYAGVVMDKSGNLYGTTDSGGRGSDCGVIYKLAPKPKGKWKYTVLYAFYGGDDGCVPAGNLVLDKKGNLYGGTVLGGVTGNGVVFELTP